MNCNRQFSFSQYVSAWAEILPVSQNLTLSSVCCLLCLFFSLFLFIFHILSSCECVCVCVEGTRSVFFFCISLWFYSLSLGLSWDVAQLEAAALHRGCVEELCQGHYFMSFVPPPRFSSPSSHSFDVSRRIFFTFVFFTVRFSRFRFVSCCSATVLSVSTFFCWMGTFSPPQSGEAKLRAATPRAENPSRYGILKLSRCIVFFNLTCPAGSSWESLFTSPTWKRKVLQRQCEHVVCAKPLSVYSSGGNKWPLEIFMYAVC